jgi:hypothetical protein
MLRKAVETLTYWQLPIKTWFCPVDEVHLDGVGLAQAIDARPILQDVLALPVSAQPVLVLALGLCRGRRGRDEQ